MQNLEPGTLSYLLSQLGDSDLTTLKHSASQLFNYLNPRYEKNPVYQQFEKEHQSKWAGWPNIKHAGIGGGQVVIPDVLRDHVSLAYSVYRSISEHDAVWARNFVGKVCFAKILNESAAKFKALFFNAFKMAVTAILTYEQEANGKSEEQGKGKSEIGKVWNSESKVVFIVHGHDESLKSEVQLLLARADVDAIVLHEQLNKGRTIIEKLIEETEDAYFAIALLTPDDLTADLEPRARENVILEIGYFLGKLGRSNVLMLLKGDLKPPSDLAGIVYKKHDVNGAWKHEILDELEHIGIHVNRSKAVGRKN